MKLRDLQQSREKRGHPDRWMTRNGGNTFEIIAAVGVGSVRSALMRGRWRGSASDGSAFLSLPADEPVVAVGEESEERSISCCHFLGQEGWVILPVGGSHEVAEAESLEGSFQCGLEVDEAVSDSSHAGFDLRRSVVAVPLAVSILPKAVGVEPEGSCRGDEVLGVVEEVLGVA